MTDALVDVWVRDTSLPGGTSAADAGEPTPTTLGLDEHERERWRGFHDRGAAGSYLALHHLARSEIARLLGRAPQSLRFDRTCADCGGQHGRPRLLDDPGLHLSLSRTGPLVALAVSRSGPVGIDVEQIDRTGFAGFARVALHPGEREGRGTRVADATAWVRKEAVLKALGPGLRVDPTTFRTPPAGVCAAVVPGMPAVTVVDIDTPVGCAGAIALVDDSHQVRVRRH